MESLDKEVVAAAGVGSSGDGACEARKGASTAEAVEAARALVSGVVIADWAY